MARDPKSVQAKDQRGWTALNWAVHNRNREMAVFLLEHGAEVDARNNLRATPLFTAVIDKQPEFIKLLVVHGADVNARDKNNFTCLDVAFTTHDMPLAKLLLASGADPRRDNWLLFIANHIQGVGWLNLALDHQANMNSTDAMGNTPLHEAARRDYIDKVQVYVTRGASINARNKDGKTPLKIAVENKSKQSIKYLRAKAAIE